jgi:hypothetical protein
VDLEDFQLCLEIEKRELDLAVSPRGTNQRSVPGLDRVRRHDHGRADSSIRESPAAPPHHPSRANQTTLSRFSRIGGAKQNHSFWQLDSQLLTFLRIRQWLLDRSLNLLNLIIESANISMAVQQRIFNSHHINKRVLIDHEIRRRAIGPLPYERSKKARLGRMGR